MISSTVFRVTFIKNLNYYHLLIEKGRKQETGQVHYFQLSRSKCMMKKENKAKTKIKK